MLLYCKLNLALLLVKYCIIIQLLKETYKGSVLKLSHDTVRSIAELAKLDLTDDEIELYAEQISDILQYFEHLQTLDTSQVEPTASVLPCEKHPSGR